MLGIIVRKLFIACGISYLKRVIKRISVPADYAWTVFHLFCHITASRVQDIFNDAAACFLGCT